MRHIFRIAYTTSIIALWLCAGILLMEVFFRVYLLGRYIAADALEFVRPVIQKHLEYDDALFRQIRARSEPPDTVRWQIPRSETFRERDEASRQMLADKRQEIILVCDGDGIIQKVYSCDVTSDLAFVSARVKPGNTFAAFLPPEQAMDAINALRQAHKEGKSVRDYNIPLDSGYVYATEFRAYPLSRRPRLFFVFLGDSVYKNMYHDYRPHIYRCDWWWRHQYIHAEFWTNALGFRDREIVLPKPKGVVRIACIGGSTTVEGPHNELTYPKMLEAILREKLGSDKIEVVNCGVDAVAFHTEYGRMPDYLAQEPNLIIHYNIINNLRAWLSDAVDASGMLSGWKGLARIIASHSKLLTALRPEWFLPSDAAFAFQLGEAVDYLEKINQAALDGGASLAVASFATPDASKLPWNERVYFDKSFQANLIVRATTADYNRFIGIYNRMAREFSKKNDVLYMPVAENFFGGVDTFTDICHMRLRGIELKASIIAEYLEDFVRERLEMEAALEASEEKDRVPIL